MIVKAGSEYDERYFQSHCGPIPYDRSHPHWLEFFGKIADEIVRRLQPTRVLDMGCAKGFLVECLRDRGVEAYGCDVSGYAVSQVRPDIRQYCWVASAGEPLDSDYDLITCIEVLEHVSEEEGRRAIEVMTNHAPTVFFSSSPNDFQEPTHVSVRPLIDWLRLFAEFSFGPDLVFDASFVTQQAMLMRRRRTKPHDDVLRLFTRSRMQGLQIQEQSIEIGRLGALHAEAALAHSMASESLSQTQAKLAETISRLNATQEQLEKLENTVAVKDATLDAVLNSQGWRLLNKYREARTQARSVLGPLWRAPLKLVSRTRSPRDPQADYQRWIERREMTHWDPGKIRASIAEFQYQPTISIVMPVYNTPREYLEKAIQSVRAQLYEKWELCIADDGSDRTYIREYLQQWAEKDPRIKVTFSPRNEGISLASNRALALAEGEFIGLLDHDDELAPHALFEIVSMLQDDPTADMIYSDEDKLGPDGERRDPFFKPDWSPELFMSCMYTCHFGVYRKSVVESIGGFRKGFEGSQDYDLVLRISEQTTRIRHVPKVLYHWRIIPGSAARSNDAKPYAYTAAKSALTEHVQRRGLKATVIDGAWPSHYRVRFEVDPGQRVSIIIPTKDKLSLLRRCVASIEKKTHYENYEILIVDNQSSDPKTLKYLSSVRHRVIPFPEPFNFSRILNHAAKQASGRYLLFLNNDTEVISEDWVSAMLEFGQQPEIGAVGAKLLYPDGTLQHAGVVVGLGGVAGHPLTGFPENTAHYFGAAGSIRNYSAVTAACMLLRREVYEQVGGFDANLSVAFNDVDFCLRVRNAGYRIVWTPFAKLFHHESASRGYRLDAREIAYMQDRWANELLNDPYYNPNLTLQSEDFGLRL